MGIIIIVIVYLYLALLNAILLGIPGILKAILAVEIDTSGSICVNTCTSPMLSIKSCQAEGRHIGQITQKVLILSDGIQLSLQAAGSWRIKGSGLLDTDREVIYSINLAWNWL